MNIKYYSEYYIAKPCNFDGEFELNKQEFEAWLKKCNYIIDDEDDLLEIFEDFVYETKPKIKEEDKFYFEDFDSFKVTTHKEDIIKELSYLIVKHEERSCCYYAPNNANYCPTCGKKLKESV